MSKPARLYPKEEPMNLNPRLILMGSVVFAILIGWIGIATTTARIKLKRAPLARHVRISWPADVVPNRK